MPLSGAEVQAQVVRAIFKAAWIRASRPDLAEAAVQETVRRLFRDAGA
jgi:hypothetical protein